MGKRIAILGGRGMLGTELAAILEREGHTVGVFDLPECDITNTRHLEQALKTADTVVNCAAFTNVDLAEEQPELAHAVNARAVADLGAIAGRRGIFVAHISTDFVFDGSGERPYTEDDPPNPLSVYGQTKLAGERALQESGCPHLIMRVEWSYGRQGANFISKLCERAQTGGELKIVDDQYGAPTWTRDMSRALATLLRKQSRGLYHFANTGYASRFEVAKFIAEITQLENTIIPCRTGEFPARAARPCNSRFDLRRVSAELDHPIRPWQAALTEYLRGN